MELNEVCYKYDNFVGLGGQNFDDIRKKIEIFLELSQPIPADIFMKYNGLSYVNSLKSRPVEDEPWMNELSSALSQGKTLQLFYKYRSNVAKRDNIILEIEAILSKFAINQ